MTHYQNNIDQVLRISQALLQAISEHQWDKIESLIQQRDQAANIAFPDNLPAEYYQEARRAYAIIQRHQQEATEISEKMKRSQKTETVNEKRGQKSIQSYLS
ncbi:MAG: hypothetical protein ACRBBW_07870 [Cellvibrionaceae bacterium]